MSTPSVGPARPRRVREVLTDVLWKGSAVTATALSVLSPAHAAEDLYSGPVPSNAVSSTHGSVTPGVITDRSEATLGWSAEASSAFGLEKLRQQPKVDASAVAQRQVEKVLSPEASPKQREQAYEYAKHHLPDLDATHSRATLEAILRRDLARLGLPLMSSPHRTAATTITDFLLRPEASPEQRRAAYQIALALPGWEDSSPAEQAQELKPLLEAAGIPVLEESWTLVTTAPAHPEKELGVLKQELTDALDGERINEEKGFRMVVQDPARPNQRLTYAEDRSIRHLLLRTSAAERAAVSKLSLDQQVQYSQVTDAAGNSPRAKLSLQKLLLDGTLSQGTDFRENKVLLDHLAELATPGADLAEGIDGRETIQELVVELATPASIDQGPRGTCGPNATVIIELALSAPAEYARIVKELASTRGVVTLKSGLGLQREPGTAKDDGTGRTTPQRLMGSAFMEVANGGREYDNASGDGAGSQPATEDILLDAVFDKHMSYARVTDFNRGLAMDVVRGELEESAHISVAVKWNEDGTEQHKILLKRELEKNGETAVEYINPQGKLETMTMKNLEERLRDISYDPAAVRPEHRALNLAQLLEYTPLRLLVP